MTSHSSTRNRHPDTHNDNVFNLRLLLSPLFVAKKGSTAVAKSHDLSKGYPVFKIETADGRLLEGSDAELWVGVSGCHRRLPTPTKSIESKIEKTIEERIFNGKVFHLIKWKGFESPLWNSWIPENEVKNAKDVFKKRHALSKKRSKTANHPAPPSSPVAHYIIEMDGALTESGPMELKYL
ncbi:Protein CBG20449 [Caenorhabditis briggsae]|uniref:Protein CBG20449 n=1 Tax=Caenorhabditis briggsae TaxID=6238 RepID=A8XXT8_CAEBR|nr:Protein CBG20449 [Caenorhabditis briggsae]CAP37457.2 Protein CBG20449 [Caenorhabditis briggsae]